MYRDIEHYITIVDSATILVFYAHMGHYITVMDRATILLLYRSI